MASKSRYHDFDATPREAQAQQREQDQRAVWHDDVRHKDSPGTGAVQAPLEPVVRKGGGKNAAFVSRKEGGDYSQDANIFYTSNRLVIKEASTPLDSRNK